MADGYIFVGAGFACYEGDRCDLAPIVLSEYFFARRSNGYDLFEFRRLQPQKIKYFGGLYEQKKCRCARLRIDWGNFCADWRAHVVGLCRELCWLWHGGWRLLHGWIFGLRCWRCRIGIDRCNPCLWIQKRRKSATHNRAFVSNRVACSGVYFLSGFLVYHEC